MPTVRVVGGVVVGDVVVGDVIVGGVIVGGVIVGGVVVGGVVVDDCWQPKTSSRATNNADNISSFLIITTNRLKLMQGLGHYLAQPIF